MASPIPETKVFKRESFTKVTEEGAVAGEHLEDLIPASDEVRCPYLFAPFLWPSFARLSRLGGSHAMVHPARRTRTRAGLDAWRCSGLPRATTTTTTASWPAPPAA